MQITIIIICVVAFIFWKIKLMIQLEKILLNDRYTREFENANTLLTVAALYLNRCTVSIIHVNSFCEHCENLAKVLIKYDKKDKLLSLYLWARAKLTTLFFKGNTGVGVKIHCRADANIFDMQINELCQTISTHNVTPLLRSLHRSNEQAQPTTHNK